MDHPIAGADALVENSQAQQFWAAMADNPVLGQYSLLHELGRGAFGRVFKAQHTVMDRMVAIKIISPERVEDKLAHSLFRREVLVATQLCHPNIVMAYDANNANGVLYLVLEYVEGTNLETQVEEQGPLPLDLAREMMRQAGLALQYAHERGMVHRDIKPANLLIPYSAGLNGLGSRPPAGAGTDGLSSAPVVLKITDFGMARFRNMAYTNTVLSKCEKGFLGTPEFISPEQAQCPRDADIRADLYSLGCSFYYAITGQPPFTGETAVQTLVKQIHEEAKPLEALRPDAAPGLTAIIRQLMAKDPLDRFQTPADLVAALDRMNDLSASPAEPVMEPAWSAPPRPEATALDVSKPEVSEPGVTAVLIRGSLDRDPLEEPCANPTVEADLKTEAASPSRLANPPLLEVPTSSVCPPDPPRPPAPDDALHEIWREWTKAVEAVAEGADPRRFNEPLYRLLHSRLLGACRARAGAADPARRDPYRRLEALVEPWMTPQALALADRATLLSLLRHCRQMEQELFVPRRPRTFGFWVAALAVLVTTAGIGAYLGRTRDAASARRSFIASFWGAVESSPVLWAVIGLLSILVLFLAILSLARRCSPHKR